MISKKLTLVLFGALFVSSNFIPYSLGGPAMSCMTAHGTREAAEDAVIEFMQNHSTRFGEVARFLQRSDFEIRFGDFAKDKSNSNDVTVSNSFNVSYRTDNTNYHCLLISVPAILMPAPGAGNFIRLDLRPTPGEPSGTAMVLKVVRR